MNYAHSLVGGAPSPGEDIAHLEIKDSAKEIIWRKESATLSNVHQHQHVLLDTLALVLMAAKVICQKMCSSTIRN